MCEKYNGWTNRETWLVNLWGFTEYDADELEAYRDNAYGLSQELESRVLDMLPDLEGFASDLMSGAVARIDWYDLADTMLLDLPDEDEDMSCDQCEAAMVNGVYTHEYGCPNRHKVKVDGEWVTPEDED